MRAWLLLVFFPSLAWANMAAPTVIPGYAARPEAGDRTPLEVVDERLRFVCREGTCDLDARYVIYNPTREAVETPVVFVTYRAEGLAATIDGRAAPQQLSAFERNALDATVAELVMAGTPQPQGRIDLRLEVAPLGRRVVRVTGRVALGRSIYRGYGFVAEAGQARHLALGGRSQAEHLFFDYLMSPINTWARVGTIQIIVEHPESWRFHGDGYVWSRREGGIHETVTRGPQQERLRVRFEVPPPAIENGGVLLGVGARLGEGLRVRAGYEVAWARSRLLSVAVETDGEEVVVAPALELALPAMIIIPSLGAGVGVPVQVTPEARVGVRGQVSAMLYAIGVIAMVDWFPGDVRGTVMGQLSF